MSIDALFCTIGGKLWIFFVIVVLLLYLCSHRKYIKIPVMKKIISLLILVLIGVMNLSASDKSIFWLGEDISGTTELEARGVQLYNAAGEPVKIPNL